MAAGSVSVCRPLLEQATITDKAGTVDLLSACWTMHRTCRAPQGDSPAVTALLDERGVAYVTLEHWLQLDRHEQELGQARGRPRVKVVSREAMLRLIDGGRCVLDAVFRSRSA